MNKEQFVYKYIIYLKETKTILTETFTILLMPMYICPNEETAKKIIKITALTLNRKESDFVYFKVAEFL